MSSLGSFPSTDANQVRPAAAAERQPARRRQSRRPRPNTQIRPDIPKSEPTRLLLLGATNAELAEAFGVSEFAIELWYRTKPEFAKALRAGKIEADAEVAARLYERAKGYDRKGKHYPPDTAAASLWLRNRRPRDWRERADSTVTGQLTLEYLIMLAVAPADAQPAIEGAARAVEDKSDDGGEPD